jgi:hypothetical protein
MPHMETLEKTQNTPSAQFGHATAVRVNRALPDHFRYWEIRRSGLGRGDGFPIENDPDLTAQQVEQDRDTIAIRHSFK